MSRLAGFYIAKMVESAASGTPPRRAGDHAAPGAIRAHRRGRSAPHRLAAAVYRFIGGLTPAGRGPREPGHLHPPQPARQPSAR
jgi:hypothetical protein